MNGIHWTGLGKNIFTTVGRSVAWNGRMWVAVGGVWNGNETNTIAYSYDGIQWTGLGTNIFTTVGRGIAWNGRMWVAVGGRDQEAGGNTIAYSYDGIHWTAVMDSLTNIFTNYGKCVAWSGEQPHEITFPIDRMVAVGVDTARDAAGHIVYSDASGMGTFWHDASGVSEAFSSATVINCVEWNGRMWVALDR